MTESARDRQLPPLSAVPTPTPVQRLEQSRERMRVWMEARRPRPRPPADGATSEVSSWLQGLRNHPMGMLVEDALGSWWKSHPLRSVAIIAGGTLREVLAPLARRHPIALVGAAAVVGGLLIRVRLWRWVLKPALFAGLLAQIASRLIDRVPLESILGRFAEGAAPPPVTPRPPEASADAVPSMADMPVSPPRPTAATGASPFAGAAP